MRELRMKNIQILSFCFLFTMCLNPKSKLDINWVPDFKHAHPNAQSLMKDELLWSPIEESSPFGNDDGADAIYKFHEWRESNRTESPLRFIEQLLKEWNYSVYDYSKTDSVKIQEFISLNSIGDRLYIGIDDLIIATGFGQFIMEGKIDKDLKILTLTALNRQIQSFSLRLFDLDYRLKRQKQLKRMIEIIKAA
jgi:uncharacterized protein YfeS